MQVIASANRNCFSKPDVQVLCLQLLYLKVHSHCAMLLFFWQMALHTLPKHRFSPPGLSHQRQVWKNYRVLGHSGHCISRSATQGNLIARTAIHASTCQWRIQGENWAAFCPSCKGKMPTEPTGEKRTAFCPSPIQNSTPKTTAA